MKLELTTEIIINAPKDDVWSTFLDFEHNQFPFLTIKPVQSPIKVDDILSVHLDFLGGADITPRVTSIIPSAKFSWLGKLWINGIFDGDHSFEIIEINDHQVTFKQREVFDGVLVWFFQSQLLTHVKQGFDDFNHALKQKCEAPK